MEWVQHCLVHKKHKLLICSLYLCSHWLLKTRVCVCIGGTWNLSVQLVHKIYLLDPWPLVGREGFGKLTRLHEELHSCQEPIGTFFFSLLWFLCVHVRTNVISVQLLLLISSCREAIDPVKVHQTSKATKAFFGKRGASVSFRPYPNCHGKKNYLQRLWSQTLASIPVSIFCYGWYLCVTATAHTVWGCRRYK